MVKGQSCMKNNIISFVIGLTAGFLGGLVGLGGGLIMIPLMVGILKLGQHRAHGTSLVALVFTGLSGAVSYALNGSIDLTAAICLAATAMLTARAGARYCHVLPAWKLKKYFGAFLIFCAILLILKPYITIPAIATPLYFQIGVFLITGVFTGFLSGMMGVGGGTIMVPAMVLLAGFSQHLAQGTSLLVMVPAGSVGAFTHWKMGNVATGILFGLVPGIILGAYLGGHIAHFIPDTPLRWAFIAVVIFMGIRYVRSVQPNDTCAAE
jgi:Predicted permeases